LAALAVVFPAPAAAGLLAFTAGLAELTFAAVEAPAEIVLAAFAAVLFLSAAGFTEVVVGFFAVAAPAAGAPPET
jgi:hypothetical protein